MISAYVADSLILLQTSQDKKEQPLFYSPERQEIIELSNTLFVDFSKSVNITHTSTHIIEWLQEDKKQDRNYEILKFQY